MTACINCAFYEPGGRFAGASGIPLGTCNISLPPWLRVQAFGSSRGIHSYSATCDLGIERDKILELTKQPERSCSTCAYQTGEECTNHNDCSFSGLSGWEPKEQ